MQVEPEEKLAADEEFNIKIDTKENEDSLNRNLSEMIEQ
jgi:hypothetical protein